MSYTATGRGFVAPFAMASGGWSQEHWDAAAQRLAERGILDADRGLTAEGEALRRRVEDDTDRLGSAPWMHLGSDGAARLGELGRTLVRRWWPRGAFHRRCSPQHVEVLRNQLGAPGVG